jgi:hypothetical protein
MYMDRMNAIQFLRYIGTPLTKDEMMLLYQANNIKYDRCELYRDFIATLNMVIIDTYLGKDVMISDVDNKKHFLWCYNKTLENFNGEGIPFKKDNELKSYLFSFYEDLFYNEELEDVYRDKLDILNNLFLNYRRIKSRSDIDITTEIYKLFDRSLGK